MIDCKHHKLIVYPKIVADKAVTNDKGESVAQLTIDETLPIKVECQKCNANIPIDDMYLYGDRGVLLAIV